MKRSRIILAGVFLLVTLALVLAGEPRGSAAAIWPSVVAVGLAFATREIYSALFLGAFAGTVLLAEGDIASAFIDLFADHLVPPLTSRWNVCALAFSLMMGGFIALLNRAGGMQAMAARLLGSGDSKRRAGLGVFGMGWLVFFDGLANCMLVGRTMRPVTDRAGLSRAKLAFIVDSTASPIAAFALISTWIAFELTLIQNGFAAFGENEFGDAGRFAHLSSYEILVRTLPYRFYNYFLLLIVFLTIWLGRDIGPMWEAEAAVKAERGGDRDEDTAEDKDASSHRKIGLTLLPLGLLIVGVFGGLYVSGLSKLEEWPPGALARTIQAFGKADADLVFVTATAFASLAAMATLRFCSGRDSDESPMTIYLEGMKEMFLPVLILVFAFTLGSVIRELKTAEWLTGALRGGFPAAALPAVVFLIAALMSFSVGTSWGTMGILMPLCIPVACALTGLEGGGVPGPVVISTIGAVLAGAVFGDHCSPISDTTIVSAFASGCDAIEHVRTQIPYALLAAGIAVTLGYGLTGLGLNPFIALALGGGTCWATIRFWGRKG
jgi:Na+/H+ antiporter NhaC